ncbi:MAG: ATP-binding protein [Ruminococcus sp.]
MAIAMEIYEMTRLENVSESTVWQLASCDFIKQRQNIVMIGTPGSGKTHLSIALGMNACEAGYRVKFYTAVNLAAELAEAVHMNRLSKLEKDYNTRRYQLKLNCMTPMEYHETYAA